MAYGISENDSGFAFQPLFAFDENGSQLFVAIVKATFRITGRSRLVIADEQAPVSLSGEAWGEPGESSWKYEPEFAFMKPSSDIVLIGSAYAPHVRTTQVDVRFSVGSVSRQIRVFGDRFWCKTFGMLSMTQPDPFEKVPLVYERAYGGHDRTRPQGGKDAVFAANPVGTGFLPAFSLDDLVPCPNLEDPASLIRNPGDRPRPAGFGFISPDWQPRALLAGTYDGCWIEERMPLLPRDFNRRFFNAASAGLIYPDYLRGEETVVVENVDPGGKIEFTLPGVPPPVCKVETRSGSVVRLDLDLDTLVVNTDEAIVSLTWRKHMILHGGPDALSIVRIGEPSPVATYV